MGGTGLARRDVLKTLTVAGIGTTVFARALAAISEGKPKITPRMIRDAEWISGISLDREQRRLMLEGTAETIADYEKLRAVEIDNGVPPALRFESVPSPADERPPASKRQAAAAAVPTRPASDTDLAFRPVSDLSAFLRERKVSSLELTRLYLERLRRFDPVLRCAITVTEDLALRQARAADDEIAAGRYRGPLHGVPWGVKDLFSVPGYRTTWGATPYRDQVRDEKATVVERLEQAGAVLVAKTSVGALAWGDVWYDGKTRNPWNTEQGSSGSSAGSASATSAGLVGFAIGTETWGSIVSPCTRCGATGLRPTFGRVSRHGAMALAWTMDKVGPIARSVEDCALVFGAIHGADAHDPTTVERPFSWPAERDPRSLRVGFVESLFEVDYTEWGETEEEKADLREWQEHDLRTLETMRGLGFRLIPMKLPDTYPVSALGLILTAEAATAFDDLTRSGRDATLVRQAAAAWPNVFRQGQMIPAVEYLRANRIRTLVMREMEDVMADIDVYLCPTFGGDNLLLTNLTGHPSVVVPNGFRTSDGTPTSITFLGSLHGETALLAVAGAYQRATDYHRQKPPEFK